MGGLLGFRSQRVGYAVAASRFSRATGRIPSVWEAWPGRAPGEHPPRPPSPTDARSSVCEGCRWPSGRDDASGVSCARSRPAEHRIGSIRALCETCAAGRQDRDRDAGERSPGAPRRPAQLPFATSAFRGVRFRAPYRGYHSPVVRRTHPSPNDCAPSPTEPERAAAAYAAVRSHLKDYDGERVSLTLEPVDHQIGRVRRRRSVTLRYRRQASGR